MATLQRESWVDAFKYFKNLTSLSMRDGNDQALLSAQQYCRKLVKLRLTAHAISADLQAVLNFPELEELIIDAPHSLPSGGPAVEQHPKIFRLPKLKELVFLASSDNFGIVTSVPRLEAPRLERMFLSDYALRLVTIMEPNYLEQVTMLLDGCLNFDTVATIYMHSWLSRTKCLEVWYRKETMPCDRCWKTLNWIFNHKVTRFRQLERDC